MTSAAKPRAARIIALATVLLAAACGHADDSPTETTAPPGPAASIRPSDRHWLCLDRPPRSPADYQVALNHHDERWQGGDGGVPVPLPDGRIAWLFGDTIVGSVTNTGKLVDGKWRLIHGTVLVQHGECFDPLAATATAPLTDLVPGPTDDQFYWPGAGWANESGDRLYVMLDLVNAPTEAQTASDFVPAGNALAELSLPGLQVLNVHAIPAPPIKGTPTWTAKPLRTGGWVYLYARDRFAHYVVRFPDRVDAWRRVDERQYWTGSGWSDQPDDLGPMHVSESPITGLSVIREGRRYLAVAMTGDDVSGWSAPTPAGPWTHSGTLAETGRRPGGVRYGALVIAGLPGIDPFILWNIAAERSGTITGSGIGTAPTLQPIG